MQDYSEKRNYPRMRIECPASYKIAGGDGGGAVVRDLSGGGLLVWIDRELAPGAVLTMEVRPISDITPPMVAEVEVLRTTPVCGAKGGFAVACQISRVLG